MLEPRDTLKPMSLLLSFGAPRQVFKVTLEQTIVEPKLGGEASQVLRVMKLVLIRGSCEPEPTHRRPGKRVAAVVVQVCHDKPRDPLEKGEAVWVHSNNSKERGCGDGDDVVDGVLVLGS